MENPFLAPVEALEEKLEQSPASKFHPYYVGVDIGYKFHVASCIPCQEFTDQKQPWKRRKTLKFNADGEGIHGLIAALLGISKNPDDFCILMEPTGGYYGYVVMESLRNAGFTTYYVENKSVKDFRERTLGINEKTDSIDCKVLAYMGFQKVITPSMHGIRQTSVMTIQQSLFKALNADRWSLQQQLTRRKNQFQQILSVTHPELKSVFITSTATRTVRRLVEKYPTGLDMAAASTAELYNALVDAGAKTHAKRVSTTLAPLLEKTVAVKVPHLIPRQKLLAQDIDRMEAMVEELDQQIKALVDSHPYKDILFSFPTMSYTWACTLIGVIGDANRFSTYKEFKKYIGFVAENKESGISVRGTHLTFQGVRDTRRVLWQMTMTLISPNLKGNPFQIHYSRLVERNMPGKKAMGHVAGKLAQVLYGCLKYGRLYDPQIHLIALGAEPKNED